MGKIQRQSLSDDVFERVQRDILSGALAADAPLRQDTLADALGVSKIPVREALTRLEQVGFVVSHPRRGYAVRGLSIGEAREIFELRLALEPALTSLAAQSATTADQGLARAALDQLESEVANGGPETGTLNCAFHEALMKPADRPLTFQTVMRLQVLAERYVKLHLAAEGRGQRAQDEHRRLLQAWRRRDGIAIERLLTAHLQRTLDDLLAEMSTQAQ